MSHFNLAVFTYTDDPDELETLLAPFDEDVNADSPYAEFQVDETGEPDDSAGERGYWLNPNAKYDWWALGGRWRGQIKLKEGKTGHYGKDSWTNRSEPGVPLRCDCAKVRDCDFTMDEEVRAYAQRFWEVVVEDQPMREGENEDSFLTFFNKSYFLEQYGTKERYLESRSRFCTHSCLSVEGEWDQVGEMNWFGLDDATAESRKQYEANFAEYLKDAAERDLYINIVDCHI